MHTRRTATVLAGVVAVMSLSLSAQWPPHAAPGVPRTPDGEPDLDGPAPRTSDGRPDLSGIWENPPLNPRGGSISGTGGAPSLDGTLPTGPPSQFFDIGARLQGGLPMQPWAADLKRQRMASGSAMNPDALCLPMGNMQLHNHPQPRKIVQTEDVVVILYEGNAGLRQIFTDGRPLPDNDPQPWWFGYSTGRWDGNTLVAQTSGFRDGGWLDVNGSPLTDAATMTERFRRPTFGRLEIEITVDDPNAYTRPWTVTVNQRIMLDTELIEFICLENARLPRRVDP